MKLTRWWLPETKYALILLGMLTLHDAATRLYQPVKQSRPVTLAEATAAVIPRPQPMTGDIRQLLAKMQPAQPESADKKAAVADPAAGQLGSMQVSLKAIFRKGNEMHALLRLVDAAETEMKAVQLNQDVNGFTVTVLQQDQIVFQQGQQQLTLRLFKNNAAAVAAGKGNE